MSLFKIFQNVQNNPINREDRAQRGSNLSLLIDDEEVENDFALEVSNTEVIIDNNNLNEDENDEGTVFCLLSMTICIGETDQVIKRLKTDKKTKKTLESRSLAKRFFRKSNKGKSDSTYLCLYPSGK
jgi:hypothetical protein